MKEKFGKNWLKFVLTELVLILMTIWIGNYFLLIGVPIIFDYYISKKVHWEFWKKKGITKKSKAMEWFDALLFAVIAATIIRMFFIEAYTIPTGSMEKSLLIGDYLFVSKVSYGPRIPNTPLSFPFAHHTMPGTKSMKSYSEWIQWPYKRLVGFGSVKRNDVVVFNYPEGDTLSTVFQSNQSYYSLLRNYGRNRVWNDKRVFGDIITRPVDKRENYVKRCVAIHGDSIEVRHGEVYINGKPQKDIVDKQYNYDVITKEQVLSKYFFEKYTISSDDYSRAMIDNYTYRLPLTQEKISALRQNPAIESVTRFEVPKGAASSYIYPHNSKYNWNEDNFGPFWIPQKGSTINLTLQNIPLYKRMIEVYENNKVKIDNDKIYINGKEAQEYTFKMDYYFMMGDNRHNSADSRFWGVVPEDHIVGKAVFIWMSIDKDKSFFKKIRWSRLFSTVK